MDEKRVELEMKITEIERLVTELNEVVYEQQKMIDGLRGQLKQLESRIDSAGGGEIPHTPPPHY